MVYHSVDENWFSHSTEKIRRGTLHFSENFFIRKKLWIGRGYHDFLSEILPHSTEKIRRGTLGFQKNSGLKKLHKMVCHDFVENWFSHSTEKLRRGTLNFSENILYRKFLWMGRRYQDFLSNFFCLTVPKKSLCFRNILD